LTTPQKDINQASVDSAHQLHTERHRLST